MTTIVAKDNNKQRVMSLLPVTTVMQMDKIRGYYSRSQFVQMAVDKFLENIMEGEEKGKMGRRQSTLLQGSDVVGRPKKSRAAQGRFIVLATTTNQLRKEPAAPAVC